MNKLTHSHCLFFSVHPLFEDTAHNAVQQIIHTSVSCKRKQNELTAKSNSSVIHRTNEVSTGMDDRLRRDKPPQYVTKPTMSTQSCIPLGSVNWVLALIGWGKGKNVTCARWQVTLCDPIWQMISRSGEVGSWLHNCYMHLPLPLRVYLSNWNSLTNHYITAKYVHVKHEEHSLIIRFIHETKLQ